VGEYEFDDSISETRGVRIVLIEGPLADAFDDESEKTASTHGDTISDMEEKTNGKRLRGKSCPSNFQLNRQ
jgi:hypothetical protein